MTGEEGESEIIVELILELSLNRVRFAFEGRDQIGLKFPKIGGGCCASIGICTKAIQQSEACSQNTTKRAASVHGAKARTNLNWVAIGVTGIAEAFNLIWHTALVEREWPCIFCTQLFRCPCPG